MGPCPSAWGAFLGLWAGRTPPLDSLTLHLPRGIAEMVRVGAQLCPRGPNLGVHHPHLSWMVPPARHRS